MVFTLAGCCSRYYSKSVSGTAVTTLTSPYTAWHTSSTTLPTIHTPTVILLVCRQFQSQCRCSSFPTGGPTVSVTNVLNSIQVDSSTRQQHGPQSILEPFNDSLIHKDGVWLRSQCSSAASSSFSIFLYFAELNEFFVRGGASDKTFRISSKQRGSLRRWQVQLWTPSRGGTLRVAPRALKSQPHGGESF